MTHDNLLLTVMKFYQDPELGPFYRTEIEKRAASVSFEEIAEGERERIIEVENAKNNDKYQVF